MIACLHNGRGKAAAFIAARGGQLDLEDAAGVGRLDVVKTFVRPDGTLMNGATQKHLIDGFAWAAEYGHTAVVEYLLDAGMPLDSRLRHDGQSALHWAGLGGHADTVRFSSARRAIDQTDPYEGAPLDWTGTDGNRGGLSGRRRNSTRHRESAGRRAPR